MSSLINVTHNNTLFLYWTKIRGQYIYLQYFLSIELQCCSQNYDCCKMIMTQGTQIKKAKECIKENHLELVNGKCPMSGKKLRKVSYSHTVCMVSNILVYIP